MPGGSEVAPAEMWALRVHAFGETPRLERVPVPQTGPEDVLVELAAGVVGHHDLTVAGGGFQVRPELPYVPGLEGAGRVVEVGTDVDPAGVSIGMPVRVLGGGLGDARSGTWAEYAAVTARAVTPVADDLELELAAAFGSVAAAAWAAVHVVGALQPGERVGVTGASGAVGSLALQLAARGGAAGLVAWSRSPERDRPGEPETAEPGAVVEPVDLLVDTVGGPLLSAHLRSVRPGGRMVLVGYTAGTELRLSLPELMAADVRLLPLNMMRRRIPRDVEAELLADAASGRLRLNVESVRPAQIGEAIERISSGACSGRLVVLW